VIAATLRRDGAEVLGVDLQGDDCLLADVGTDDGNRQMVDEALARHGRLDILTLNAGVEFTRSIVDTEEAEWELTQNVLSKGPWLAMKHAWGELTARPGGRVIVTASTHAFIASRYVAAYTAGKHAVAGLVKTAAVEGAPFGLTANAVAPGWMMTALVEAQIEPHMRLSGRSREELLAQWSERVPAKRPVEPLEVAELVAFLAGEHSSGISGAIIPVDLGLLASS
jgi:3-hydroxybutyrate dehydrogenase